MESQASLHKPISVLDASRPVLSIIIKAYNEEAHIEEAVMSALACFAEVEGEVILADSASTDSTVALVARHNIRIVRLANPSERCCGVGPELGYQHSAGSYVWIADGDMVLRPDFVMAAIKVLDEEQDIAGVGGIVVEVNVTNLEFERRSSSKAQQQTIREERKWLSQGGIYRRSAIASIGYLSDSNLHSYEEFELGLRLRAKDWRLVSLPIPSCEHYGHTETSYKLLWRRLKSRYAYGAGEVLRASMERGATLDVIRDLREVRLWLAYLVFWGILLLLASLSFVDLFFLGVALAFSVLPIIVAWLRLKSLRKAMFAVASWNVFTVGFVLGFCSHRRDPSANIASEVLTGEIST